MTAERPTRPSLPTGPDPNTDIGRWTGPAWVPWVFNGVTVLLFLIGIAVVALYAFGGHLP